MTKCALEEGVYDFEFSSKTLLNASIALLLLAILDLMWYHDVFLRNTFYIKVFTCGSL